MISVVIAVYDEEAVIEECYRRVTLVCRAVAGASYEIIFVNDGSTDSSWRLIRALGDQDGNVRGLSLSRNFGHQVALSAGLAHARGERILILDADLQDPPELLPQMMALMDTGVDVVYGERIQRDGETRFKKASAALFYWLINRLADANIPPNVGDFRLISRRIALAVTEMTEQHRFIRGMITWTGFKQVPLPYRRHRRFAGTTKYPLRKMLKFAFDAITGFSIAPLRLAFCMGIGSIAAAGALMACFLGAYLYFDLVPGWLSIVCILLFFFGIQSLLLGIFGEYLGRMFIQAKSRPLYLIAEKANCPTEQHEQRSA